MEIERKSVGFLIDELITTSNKMWHLQDAIEEEGVTDEFIAEAFRKIQKLNVRRNKLINAIDELVDLEAFSATEKTYE